MSLSSLCLQNGDSYLVHLAARYSMDLGTLHHEVLQQLEDLRLAEWSDRAPPPPSAPNQQQQHKQKQQNHLMINSHLGPRYGLSQYLVSAELFLSNTFRLGCSQDSQTSCCKARIT